MQQKRFVLALVISTAILFGWSYFFPPKTLKQDNSNNTGAAPQASATPSPSSQPTTITSPSPQQQSASSGPEIAHRTLTVKTPLYDAVFDSHGAVITSWIIKNINKDDGTVRHVYSVGGNKSNPLPLQLISQEGLKREPREAPLRLVLGDGTLDGLLASSNYELKNVDGDGSEIVLDISQGEKRIEFVLHDESTGLDVVKGITFDAKRYDVGLDVKLTRAGQQVPQAQLVIGPSIGDQGIPKYSFYSVAPEGIAVVDGKAHRLLATAIETDQEGWIFKSTRPGGPHYYGLNGELDWAGVGDTYFAMMAVPSRRMKGLEFRTSKYQHEANGVKDDRFLLNAFVPIPVDGSRTQLYIGPKDHDLLTNASVIIGQTLGRKDPLDLEESIDYGLFSTVSRPIAVPILKSIKWLYKITKSYGVSIILFTIVIYSLFFPLKWRSSKSMKKAQKLAPRMKELQEKIKGMNQKDPKLKELQMEQLRLMKEGNPLGGCLPLLIQMPFLFALYRAITISIDFRQASFLWIPDLSAPEPYMIHLLPILMASSMIVLQLITPAPSADPLQRKMMAIGMPLFMLYILWSAPAGLLVYWLVGNIVGFGQQFLINRLTKSEDDKEPPAEKSVEKRSTKKLKPARA